MKKKYITLKEVLALRGTDTKIYVDFDKDHYYGFDCGYLCHFSCSTNELLIINVDIFSIEKPYILEPEEFKIEKTGLYKTRDGRTAYVGYIYLTDTVRGFIEGSQHDTEWFKNGHYYGDCDGYDLVEYIGD